MENSANSTFEDLITTLGSSKDVLNAEFEMKSDGKTIKITKNNLRILIRTSMIFLCLLALCVKCNSHFFWGKSRELRDFIDKYALS